MITGFDTYSETKLYIPCPHCEHQIETNLPQFILAMNGLKKIICAACTREYELKVELLDTRNTTPHAPVGSVAGSETSKQDENDRPKACPDFIHKNMLDEPRPYHFCPDCGKRLSSVYANE